MGVRFFDKENMSAGESHVTSTRTSCNCNNTCCNQQTQTSAATNTATRTTASSSTTSFNSGINLNLQKSGILREIVGNCKEMKIEDNTHNLRIVGNDNRVRISLNVGDITVIGNNTRLKIKTNHGHIKYTGNDGRISLGKNSTEQLVDYNGCNGILKVENSTKSSQVRNNEMKFKKNNTAMGTTTSINGKSNNCKKQNVKYASYSGSPSSPDTEVFKCLTDYSNIFNRIKSMPNITTKTLNSEKESRIQSHQLPNNNNIANNFSNIIITNSSNICISPYSCNY